MTLEPNYRVSICLEFADTKSKLKQEKQFMYTNLAIATYIAAVGPTFSILSYDFVSANKKTHHLPTAK